MRQVFFARKKHRGPCTAPPSPTLPLLRHARDSHNVIAVIYRGEGVGSPSDAVALSVVCVFVLEQIERVEAACGQKTGRGQKEGGRKTEITRACVRTSLERGVTTPPKLFAIVFDLRLATRFRGTPSIQLMVLAKKTCGTEDILQSIKHRHTHRR